MILLSLMSLPDVETKLHEQYRDIFVTDAFGGLRNGYFEFDLSAQFSNFEPTQKTLEPRYDKTSLQRVIQCKIIAPPMALKSIVMFLQKTITEYEKIFGTIPSPEEIAAKAGKDNLK